MDHMMSAGSGSTALILLFVLIAVVAGSIVTGLLMSRLGQRHDEDALLELLRRRYAAGEIDEEEYLKRRSALDV